MREMFKQVVDYNKLNISKYLSNDEIITSNF